MKTNKEKFTTLVSTEKINTIQKNRDRIKNRARIRESQNIAIMVLNQLDDWGWSQRRLAEEMNVTPQQITKIVKGKENLTLETIVKLQKVLKIGILTSFYNQPDEEGSVSIKYGETTPYTCTKKEVVDGDMISAFKKVDLIYDAITSTYNQEAIPA